PPGAGALPANPDGTGVRMLDGPPPPPGTAGPMSRPTPDAIGGLLEGGGFSNIEVEEGEVTFEFDAPEEFTQYMKEIAPPLTAMIDPHPQEVQDATWAAITEAVREQASDDGSVSLTSLVLFASGSA